MKGKLFLVLILLSNINIHSQTILERLDSPDVSIRLKALIEIRDNNLTEYMDALVERSFKQPDLTLNYYIVEILFKFEYDDIVNFLHQLIDICDQFPVWDSPHYYKVEATELLVKLGDFSTVNYAFEYISQSPVGRGGHYVDLLKDIGLNMPEHSQEIKDLLINIKDNSTFFQTRNRALEHLILIYGESSLQQEIRNSVINDPEINVRGRAIKYYNFSDRKELLEQQIQNDTYWGFRTSYSETLLDEFGEPEDLKFIIDYSIVETDSLVITAFENLIFAFIPPKPDTLDWNGLTTRLINYTNEMYGYNWILNSQTRDYYLGKLNGIIESLTETSQIDEACSIIETQILPQLENDLNVIESITIEAYKFLHHYTNYIKEELEEQYGACP